MRPAAADHRYWAGLDGLRAIAVLAVLSFHVLPQTLPGGFWGVDLFFVLSGFLITGILLRWPADGPVGPSLLRFCARRWWRLSPALALMLLVVLAVAWLWPQPAATRLAWSQDVAWSAAYLSNWARALGWHATERLGHTWSLAVEEQFYLVWPCVLWGLRRWWPSPAACLAGVVVLALVCAAWRWHLLWSGADVARLYNGTDTRLETLLWGAALAIAWWHWPAHVARCAVPAGLAAVAVWAAALWASQWDAAWVYQWGISVMAWSGVALVACVLTRPDHVAVRWLASPPLVALGVWSYGIYLWHFPLLRAGLALQWQGVWLWCAVVLGSVALAALSFRWLETPILRWRERRFPA